MKLVLKNSKLVFETYQELYTGIFNVSPTRVNQFFKDCRNDVNNIFPKTAGNNAVPAFDVKKIDNPTKLTYLDVFSIPEIHGNSYELRLFNVNAEQHITIGFWVKNDTNTRMNSTALLYVGGTYVALLPVWRINQKVSVNGTGSYAGTTFSVEVTKETLGSEEWLFFEVHADFDSTPSDKVSISFYALTATAGLETETANWTLIYDNVDLDPMTYYPAEGDNPQKDPSVE